MVLPPEQHREEVRLRIEAVRRLVDAGWACDPDVTRAMAGIFTAALRHLDASGWT